MADRIAGVRTIRRRTIRRGQFGSTICCGAKYINFIKNPAFGAKYNINFIENPAFIHQYFSSVPPLFQQNFFINLASISSIFFINLASISAIFFYQSRFCFNNPAGFCHQSLFHFSGTFFINQLPFRQYF